MCFFFTGITYVYLDRLYNGVKFLWALCVFFGYNLQFYVAIQAIWPKLKNKFPLANAYLAEIILRTVLVVLTSAIGLSVPCLEQLISLVGSLALAALAISLPPVLEIIAEMPDESGDIAINQVATVDKTVNFDDSLSKPAQPNLKLVVFRDVVIFTLGLIGACSGTFVTIKEIIEKLNSPQGCR